MCVHTGCDKTLGQEFEITNLMLRTLSLNFYSIEFAVLLCAPGAACTVGPTVAEGAVAAFAENFGERFRTEEL